MRILKDTKGNSTLIYSIAILFFLLITTVFVLGSLEFKGLILNISNTAKTTLEEYINTETINEMDSVKNGTDYILQIDREEYKQILLNEVGSSSGNDREIEIENLTISSNENLDITLKFTLLMSFEILDTQIITFDREIEITSKYTSKFRR